MNDNQLGEKCRSNECQMSVNALFVTRGIGECEISLTAPQTPIYAVAR